MDYMSDKFAETARELRRVRSLIRDSFTPGRPVSQLDNFAGRRAELEEIVEAIQTDGATVIIYGERGVGKTSLSDVVEEFASNRGLEINECELGLAGGVTFATIMKELAAEFEIKGWINDFYKDNPPDYDMPLAMINFLKRSSATGYYLLRLDELDKMKESENGIEEMSKLTNFLKLLSDAGAKMSVKITPILVGIADSVEELVAHHVSVSRALFPVRVPRMTDNEAMTFLKGRFGHCDVATPGLVVNKIAELASGVPHFVHFLAKASAMNAISSLESAGRIEEISITDDDLRAALPSASEEVDVDKKYLDAIQAQRKGTNFAPVMLSCSLIDSKDPYGYFSKTDVVNKYRVVSGKNDAVMANITSNIDQLATDSRGAILDRKGTSNNYRYRFSDPMMETYVRIKAFSDGELGFVSSKSSETSVSLRPVS
ncbi:hypothetical protein [Corynebacterium variabile]|uniref:hypothetical protein n=1 Tax=Corynebacterium variabile TaxID=1727 RepID=UPI003FD4AFB5